MGKLYLFLYPTDLRQIFCFGRTTTANDQNNVSFSIYEGALPWQSNFVGFGARTLLDAYG